MILPARPVTRDDFARLVKRPPRTARQSPAQIAAALKERSATMAVAIGCRDGTSIASLTKTYLL